MIFRFEKLDTKKRLIKECYLKNQRNIIITGASGCGKSYLGNAFGINACEQGYRVKYVRLPDLLQELEFSKMHIPKQSH